MARQTAVARQSAALATEKSEATTEARRDGKGAPATVRDAARAASLVPRGARAALPVAAFGEGEAFGGTDDTRWVPGGINDESDVARPRERARHQVAIEGARPGKPVGGVGGGEDLLAEKELKEIEREHAGGLTSVQIVDIFTRRGLRFSEATFRKYVQQGLLPRSRRVGRKGKHQGSLGLYPAATVRRINLIKGLQAENYTIEEIQRQFLRFRDDIEVVTQGLRGLFDGFAEEIARPHFDPGTRRQLKKDLAETQLAAEELLKQLNSIERRVVAPVDRGPGGGAPGGAEDLL